MAMAMRCSLGWRCSGGLMRPRMGDECRVGRPVLLRLSCYWMPYLTALGTQAQVPLRVRTEARYMYLKRSRPNANATRPTILCP